MTSLVPDANPIDMCSLLCLQNRHHSLAQAAKALDVNTHKGQC